MKRPNSRPACEVKSLDATPIQPSVVNVSKNETGQYEKEGDGHRPQTAANLGHSELVACVVDEYYDRRNKTKPGQGVKLVYFGGPHLDRIGSPGKPA